MIVKGSQRGAFGLADHLLRTDENESVEVTASRGVVATDVYGAIAELDAQALGTRARKRVFHAHISPDRSLSPEQWSRAWSVHEEVHCLTGHAFIEVQHGKRGRPLHRHRIYTRYNMHGELASQHSLSRIKNELISRKLEFEFGHALTPGRHDSTVAKWARERGWADVAAFIHQLGLAERARYEDRRSAEKDWKCHQQQKRTGVDVDGLRAAVLRAWEGTADQQSFRDALATLHMTLVRGDRAEHVLVDARGGVHELARTLRAARKATGAIQRIGQVRSEVAERLAHDRVAVSEKNRTATVRTVRLTPEAVIKQLSRRQATFTRNDLDGHLAKHVADARERSELVDRVLSASATIKLTDAGSDRTSRYASRELFDIERKMLRQAMALAKCRDAAARPENLQASLKIVDQKLLIATAGGGGLTEDQRTAIEHLAGSRRLSIVHGFAGAGKSTALEAVKIAWVEEGRTVHGVAPTGKAAQALRAAGIEATTVHTFLRKLETDVVKLNRRSVVVLDEGGMADSRLYARLIDAVHVAGAKLAVIQDPKQLQAVAAGAPGRAIAERVGYVSLTNVVRQREEWQRRATIAFNTGRTREGLAAYHERGALSFHETRSAAREALVQAWNRDRIAQPNAAQLILAHSRAEVRALNDAARTEMRKSGHLSGPDVRVQVCQKQETVHGDMRITREQRPFAVGDRILFRQNDPKLNVQNGSFGTLTRIGEQGHRFIVAMDSGNTVGVDTRNYAAIDHGFATTIHASQGSTVDRSYVLATRSLDQSLTLVAASRHRSELHIHAARADFRNGFDGLARQLSRVRKKDSTLDYELPTAVADARRFNGIMSEIAAVRSWLNDKIRTGIAALAAWSDTGGEVTAAGRLQERNERINRGQDLEIDQLGNRSTDPASDERSRALERVPTAPQVTRTRVQDDADKRAANAQQKGSRRDLAALFEKAHGQWRRSLTEWTRGERPNGLRTKALERRLRLISNAMLNGGTVEALDDQIASQAKKWLTARGDNAVLAASRPRHRLR